MISDTEMKEKLKEVEWVIKPKRFKNKKTGEIKTQLNIFELKDYEELKD